LIASMDDIRMAAESNARALNGILTVLESARRKVDELHAQWERAPDSWLVKANNIVSAATPPFGVAGVFQEKDQRAELNAKAQQVMRDTDQSVYEYLPHLVVVDPHGSTWDPGDHWTPFTPGSSPGSGPSPRGGGVRRPTIPPAPPPAVVDPSPQDPGPTLSGSPMPGQRDPVSWGQQPGQPTAGSGGAEVPPVPGSAWVQTPVGRVLRSGAVLGAPPEPARPAATSGAGTADGHENARSGTRAGPEGGLWGGAMGAGRPADRRRQRTLPPDTQWPVPKGVPPVLEPGPEPVHDPGPGVIGIDR
jgi:hypothetical protein